MTGGGPGAGGVAMRDDAGVPDASAGDASMGSGGASTGGTTSTTDSGAGGSGGTGGNASDGGSSISDSGSDTSPPTEGGELTADAAPPGLTTNHAACGDAGVHGCPAPHILSTEPSPWAVALDADHVYFTSSVSAGSVIRVPIGGGNAETVTSGVSFPTYLAVAAGDVFWVDRAQPQGQQYPGRLMQAPITGGTAVQLAGGGITGVASVTSDGTSVYYWDNFNQVFAAPVGGGTGRYVYRGLNNTNIVDMTLYGQDLYYTNNGTWNSNFTAKLPGTANVDRITVTGQPSPELIVQGLNYPLFQIAVDGTNVFYNDDKFIYRTGMYGGKPKRLVSLPASSSSPVVDMISDGQNLYFTDGKLVYREPVGGGGPDVISWGWHAVQSLALDADNLYFADTSGGYVVQMPK